MKRSFAFASALVFCLMACASAYADEFSDNWMSVRALGMGNAYTAIVRNSDSLFYNPAGLSRNTGFSWTIFDPRVGLNGMDAIENAQVLMNMSDDPQGTIDKLYGKRLWVNTGMKSAILLPNIGFAAFASGNAGVAVSNPANTTMNLNYFFDYGFALGAGFELIPKVFHVGVVGRRLNRTGTTLPLGPSVLATLDPATIEGELKRRGVGYGFDLGAVLTIPGPVSPSLSFVYRNIGTTQFSHDEGAGAPPAIPAEMVIGGGIEISGGLVTITPTFDLRHVSQNDLQLGNKLHLGVEVDLPLIDLRAGLSQGYWTAGLGLGMGLIDIDFASYGVELGAYPGQQEDRRYLAQMTIELGIDPGYFGFGSGGSSGKPGERRRLKQRR